MKFASYSKFIMTGISKNDSLKIKGFAVLLLLCHHLFLFMPQNNVIEFHPYIIYFGKLSKICVHIFLIVSGYGLVSSFQEHKSLLYFYKKRFLKLYPCFLLIAITGILVSWFIYHLPPEKVYENVSFRGHTLPRSLCMVMQILGLQDLIPFSGYNPTWWFMTLILFCYVIFPFLFEVIRKYPIMTLLLMVLLTETSIVQINFGSQWLIPFTAGMTLAVLHENNASPKTDTGNGKVSIQEILFCLISSCLTLAVYFTPARRIFTDTLLSIFIIALLSFMRQGRILMFLGKYSYGIFLNHTFIYYYWFPHIVYYYSHPLWCVSVLLAASFLWSFVVDLLLILFANLFMYLKLNLKSIYKIYSKNFDPGKVE